MLAMSRETALKAPVQTSQKFKKSFPQSGSSSSNKRQKSKPAESKEKCNFCGKTSHVEANCWKKKSSTFNILFSGDNIYTTVTQDPAIVAQWIYDISSIYGHFLIVGLDVEWRPNTIKHQKNPAATLQLCVGRSCLIYQLLHSPYFPIQLIQFLSYSNHVFVGIDVKSDLEKLQRDFNIGNYAKTMDLRNLAADVYQKKDLKQAGLKTLAKLVLGKDIEKPKSVTMSNWDNRLLTPDQVQYACIDAFVSFEIGRMLNVVAFVDALVR